MSATPGGPPAGPHREYVGGVPLPPQELPIRWATAMGRPVEGAEQSFPFDDGTVRPAYGNAVPVLTPEGEVRGYVAAFMDITGLKNAEQALREADRRKDEFLATLAQELRNPLAPVRNAVRVLPMKGSHAPELQWAREVIDRQVQGMTGLIDDLMDVSRIARGKLQMRKERIPLHRVVGGAVETSPPLIEANGHELTARGRASGGGIR